MKIKFNVNDILPQVTQVASVVNQKATIQILADIILKSYKDKNGDVCLMATASDNETFVSMKAPLLQDSDDDFAIAINAKDFVSTLRNLSGHTVAIETKENQTCVGKYANGHFSMPYDIADDFPIPSITGEQKEILINAQRLLNAIASTEYASATDELRPIMNGVHFDFTENGMVVVATDGMKLSKYTDTTIKASNSDDVTGLTLPSKPAHIMTLLLAKREGEVKLAYNSMNVVLSCAEFRVIARVQEGRYPNYNSVIPKNNSISAIVKRDELVGALSRVMPMGNNASELVALTFDNGVLTINAEDIDYSKSATEKISCEYEGQKFAIGFKGSTLMSVACKIANEYILFKMEEPSRAALALPKTQGDDVEYMSLLMPMLLTV